MVTAIAGREVAASTTIRPAGAAAADWRASAVAEYERAREVGEAALRADLAARVRDLTGRAISPASVIVTSERRGLAWVDSVQFRLEGCDLTVARPCAHCGVGEVVSPPVQGRADLGYVLGAWEPRCRHCPIEDPADVW
jgi:hypothetical protein